MDKEVDADELLKQGFKKIIHICQQELRQNSSCVNDLALSWAVFPKHG